MILRVQMILTDMNKCLKMLVDETRGSFGGAENKKHAAPTFAVVVRKVLCVNGVGFSTF